MTPSSPSRSANPASPAPSGAANVSSLHGRSLERKQGEREAQTSSGAQTGRMPRLKGCLVNRQEQERRGLSWERQREKCVRPEFTSSMGHQAPGGGQEGKRRLGPQAPLFPAGGKHDSSAAQRGHGPRATSCSLSQERGARDLMVRTVVLGSSLVVQSLGLWAFTALAQLQSLVRELRSCKL